MPAGGQSVSYSITNIQGHKELVAMKDRKGIARLALRTGTPIVPAYSFGNTTAAWEERNKQRDVSKFSTETTSFAGDRVVLILRGRKKYEMTDGI